MSIKKIVKDGYDFWLYLPEEYKDQPESEPLPVIVFLHGRSLSGNNLEKVKQYGVLNEITRRRRIPVIVVAPQCPVGQSWNPQKVMNVLNYVENNYTIDTNRVYLTGMSLGGYGVLHFTGKYPDRVAATIALCGGGNTTDSLNLASVPLWIMHGKKDRAVPYSESKKIVDAILNVNGGQRLKSSFFENLGHRELARAFTMDEFYEWLFLHSRQHSDTIITDHLEIAENRFRSRSLRTISGSESLPADRTGSNSANEPKVYIIQKGDTLSHIAKRYNVNIEQICQLNGISRVSVLKIGNKLILP